jgi:hypothetical protein
MSTLRHDGGVYTLILNLFRCYVAASNLDTKEAETVNQKQLYEWVKELEILQGSIFPDKEELLRVHPDLTEGSFELVEAIFSDPFKCCGALFNLWPSITLSSRKPAAIKVTKLVLSMAVEYEDGVVVNIAIPATPAMSGGGSTFTDGNIVTMWRAQLQQATTQLQELGSQGIHELYGQKFAQIKQPNVDT